MQFEKIPKDFYLSDTLTVAKNLIGCYLTVFDSAVCFSDVQSLPPHSTGIIVETEGYLGKSDTACHSYKANPKGRTNVMYSLGGVAYVYLIYGMYKCFNVVTRKEGVPEAVLIRALAPCTRDADVRKFSGPGKLCRSLNIGMEDYNCDITGNTPSRIIISRPLLPIQAKIAKTVRVGVENSGESANLPYRFVDLESKSVSKLTKFDRINMQIL